MTKEMLRDKSLDWFEAIIESKIQEGVTWVVMFLCILSLSAVYALKHF